MSKNSERDALIAEIDALKTHKTLIGHAKAKVHAEYVLLNKEYNRVRHVLANRVAKLRKMEETND